MDNQTIDLIDLYARKKGIRIVDKQSGQSGDILIITNNEYSKWLKSGPHEILYGKDCGGPEDCIECRKCPNKGHYYMVKMSKKLGELTNDDCDKCVTCLCDYYIYEGISE